MNKKVAVLFFSLILFICNFLNVHAYGYERIDTFYTVVGLNKDSSINVREDITYNSDNLIKHGIYRDIKLLSSTGKKIKISDIQVNSPYTIEYPNKDIIRLKIGDPDKTFSGERFYSIIYKINGAVSYFKDFDEIYWNATGNGWPFPIIKANVQIIFPDGVNSINNSCYYGPVRSTLKCNISKTNPNASSTPEVQIASVPIGTMLLPGDGLTFASSFSKGVVFEPPFWENIDWSYLAILLPILSFLYMFIQWNKYGKDPKSNRTIIAEYEAPDNLTPIEAAGVLNEEVGSKSISAEIIYLAIKGYIKIECIEKEVTLSDFREYILHRVNDTDPENEADKNLLNFLFSINSHDTTKASQVKMSDLENIFYKHISKIGDFVFIKLVAGDYFVNDPRIARIKYYAPGHALFIIAFILLKLHEYTILYLVNILLSSAIFYVFAYFMPKRTENGLITKESILGLKEYLQIAEKDRINFHNAPEKKPEIFEKLLPYAMVLGVEKAWAKEFEDMYIQPPTWYYGYHISNFNSQSFCSDLNGFVRYSERSIVKSPSGSSGGGSSGGGGGGGGGGSW